LEKRLASKNKFKGEGVARARPSNPKDETLGVVQLGLGSLLFSTYNFKLAQKKE
jgi:hypothetical protein